MQDVDAATKQNHTSLGNEDGKEDGGVLGKLLGNEDGGVFGSNAIGLGDDNGDNDDGLSFTPMR